MSERRIPNLPVGLLLVSAAILTVVAYLPGLQGGFLFDDLSNIVHNKKLHIVGLDPQSLLSAAFSGDAGPLGRPVTLLTFAVNHYFSGLDPSAFKITNLVIHILTGCLLFQLTTLLLQADHRCAPDDRTSLDGRWVAAITTVLWLLHPIQLTSVLYVVQRMTSLAALFTCLALVFYLMGRMAQISGRRGYFPIALSLLVFFPLAVFSKETGLLLPLYIFLIEWLILDFRMAGQRNRVLFKRLAFATLAIASLGVLWYFWTNPEFVLQGYRNRDFDLGQRLMTEARVLWYYIYMIVVPSTHQMGLFHDDILISRDLTHPLTTIWSLLGLLALLFLSFRWRKRNPIVSLGILFFLAGHLLESTIFSLEIAFEHRNYLPSYGLILAASYTTLRYADMSIFSSRKTPALLLLAFASVFALSTVSRSLSWSDRLSLGIAEATHHPRSPRAQYLLGDAYADFLQAHPDAISFYPLATEALERSSTLSTSNNDGLFRLLPFSMHFGGGIPSEWIDELDRRLSKEIFPANNVNMLNWLVNCGNKDPNCFVPRKILKRLLDDSLSNPHLVGDARSELLVVVSKFYFNELQDPGNALRFLAAAVNNSPESPRLHFYLARLLTLIGHIPEARKQLQIASDLDRVGAYRKEILSIYSKIDREQEMRG